MIKLIRRVICRILKHRLYTQYRCGGDFKNIYTPQGVGCRRCDYWKAVPLVLK